MKGFQAFFAAREAADRLQLISFPLGYNVMVEAKTAEGAGPAEVTFHVRRIDHLSGPTHVFSSVAEVHAFLNDLATLPRYRLDLTGDPQVQELSTGVQPFTTIIDVPTGEKFNVRAIDIEAATTLHIHADQPPTGNWHLEE